MTRWVMDDEKVSRMRRIVGEKLQEIDDRLSFHDFRMVEGPEHTNLIFDVVLPYALVGKEQDIQQLLEQKLQEPGMRYYTVITFDAESFNS